MGDGIKGGERAGDPACPGYDRLVPEGKGGLVPIGGAGSLVSNRQRNAARYDHENRSRSIAFQDRTLFYLPCHFGGRFSENAFGPSI
jgi:hypothetical protein